MLRGSIKQLLAEAFEKLLTVGRLRMSLCRLEAVDLRRKLVLIPNDPFRIHTRVSK